MDKKNIETITMLIREKGNDILKELKDEVLSEYATSLELSSSNAMENKDEMNHQQLVEYIIQMRRNSWVKYLKESGKISQYPVTTKQIEVLAKLCKALETEVATVPTNSLDMSDIIDGLMKKSNALPATEAQAKLLESHNLFVKGMSKGQASIIINENQELFSQVSDKQISALKNLISNCGMRMKDEDIAKLDKASISKRIAYFIDNQNLIRLLKRNSTMKSKDILTKINSMTKEAKAQWEEELLLEESKDMFADIE